MSACSLYLVMHYVVFIYFVNVSLYIFLNMLNGESCWNLYKLLQSTATNISLQSEMLLTFTNSSPRFKQAKRSPNSLPNIFTFSSIVLARLGNLQMQINHFLFHDWEYGCSCPSETESLYTKKVNQPFIQVRTILHIYEISALKTEESSENKWYTRLQSNANLKNTPWNPEKLSEKVQVYTEVNSQ